MQRKGVALGINVLDRHIGSLGNAAFLAAATEGQNIALLVVAGVDELGASQVTPHQDGVVATPILDVFLFDQQFANLLVQRLAFVIAGAYDERLLSGLMSSQIIQRDTLVPCRSVTNLRKAALFREQAERRARHAARGQLDGALQLRVALAAHYLEFGDSHVIREQLPDGRSRFDRMVLSLIADKKNSLDALLPRGLQDSVGGSRGEQAGFIHDPQFRPGARRQGLLEEAGNRARVDAYFAERFDAATGHTKPAYVIAAAVGKIPNRADCSGLRSAGEPFDRRSPVARVQRKFRRLDLIGEQPSRSGPFLDLSRLGDGLRLPDSRAHEHQIVALEIQHLIRGKGASRMPPVGFFGADKRAALFSNGYPLAYSREVDTAHTVLEGRRFESAAVNYGIAFGRVRSGELKCGGSITAIGGVNVAAPERLPQVCTDVDAVSARPRAPLRLELGLVVIGLGLPGFQRCELGCCRTFQGRFGHVPLDVLSAL